MGLGVSWEVWFSWFSALAVLFDSNCEAVWQHELWVFWMELNQILSRVSHGVLQYKRTFTHGLNIYYILLIVYIIYTLLVLMHNIKVYCLNMNFQTSFVTTTKLTYCWCNRCYRGDYFWKMLISCIFLKQS